jgi:O-antigen/teichoic acid export membrane protein
MRSILKAFTKTSSGAIISLALSTVTVKIFAVMLGPAAVGLLSLLRQIYNTALIAATMSGQTALVQGGSARKGAERLAYLRTVLVIFLVMGIAGAVLLVALAPSLALQVLNRQDATGVWMVRLLALPLLLTVLNGYALGVLNINRSLGRMAMIQISSAAITAILAFPLALMVRQGQELALLGTVLLTPLFIFGLTVYSLHRVDMLLPLTAFLHQNLRWDIARSFFSFAGVTVVTALLTSIVMLFVRSMIVDQGGLSAAGIFDAAWTLSMTYVTLVTTAFGTYYLPTLSSFMRREDQVALMQSMFRFVTVVAVPVIMLVIVLKPFVLRLLFSSEFLPALSLMTWMLIGDFFKLTSWVKAYPMLAFADLKLYFWTEVLFQLLFLGGSVLALRYFGEPEGVAVTFSALYVVYYVAMSMYVGRKFSFSLPTRISLNWWAGLILVVSFSFLTWHSTEVDWRIVGMSVLCSTMYLTFSLTRSELCEVLALIKNLGRYMPNAVKVAVGAKNR